MDDLERQITHAESEGMPPEIHSDDEPQSHDPIAEGVDRGGEPRG